MVGVGKKSSALPQKKGNQVLSKKATSSPTGARNFPVTALGGGAALRASVSSRRTVRGSQNPIIADADAGVVGVVIVVDDRGFIRCGEPAAAALSMLSA